MSDTPASLIIAASEHDSNLYYACRFLAPDAFVFLQVDGRRLAEPVLRERRRLQVVSGERLMIHDLAFDLRKIRDRAGRRANFVQKL